MDGRRTRVLLADDHRIFAEALGTMLMSEYELVGTVSDGLQLLAVAERLRPDIVITDLSMPHLNGIDATRKLVRILPDVRVIILTMHANPEYAALALRHGARGFMVKTCSAEELNTAMQLVMEGRVYVARLLAQDVVSELVAQAGNDPRLTTRQREVLTLIAKGLTMKRVAAELSISRRTVEYHKYRIMKQLDIHSVAGLVSYAVRSRIVDAESLPLQAQ